MFKTHCQNGHWNVIFYGKPLPLPSGGYRNQTAFYCEARDQIRAEQIARALNEMEVKMKKKREVV